MKQEQYTQEEKKELLEVARATLEHKILEETIYEPETDNKKFLENRGVFITLHLHGKLRGCIGNIEPIKTIIDAVRDNAISSAFEDPRFLPLTRKELSEVDIEISILTKPQESTLEQIKPGIGVILIKGTNSATFLPQVWKDLSTKEQFLSHLCQKAGLEEDCSQSQNIKFYTYKAIVFGEK